MIKFKVGEKVIVNHSYDVPTIFVYQKGIIKEVFKVLNADGSESYLVYFEKLRLQSIIKGSYLKLVGKSDFFTFNFCDCGSAYTTTKTHHYSWCTEFKEKK